MINIQGSTQDIFWFDFKSDKKHQKLYTLDIRPVMVLKNCLPVPIFYTLNDENAGDWAFIGITKTCFFWITHPIQYY